MGLWARTERQLLLTLTATGFLILGSDQPGLAAGLWCFTFALFIAFGPGSFRVNSRSSAERPESIFARVKARPHAGQIHRIQNPPHHR